jgi:hypothetical protein
MGVPNPSIQGRYNALKDVMIDAERKEMLAKYEARAWVLYVAGVATGAVLVGCAWVFH